MIWCWCSVCRWWGTARWSPPVSSRSTTAPGAVLPGSSWTTVRPMRRNARSQGTKEGLWLARFLIYQLVDHCQTNQNMCSKPGHKRWIVIGWDLNQSVSAVWSLKKRKKSCDYSVHFSVRISTFSQEVLWLAELYPIRTRFIVSSTLCAQKVLWYSEFLSQFSEHTGRIVCDWSVCYPIRTLTHFVDRDWMFLIQLELKAVKAFKH